MNEKQLIQLFLESGINLSTRQAEQFVCYGDLLVTHNRQVNLTAITDPREIAVKHFLDSAMLLAKEKLPQGSSVVDVGTGAGFPSVPLLICRPDLKMTMIDALAKRVSFLEALLTALGLTAQVVHMRGEDAGDSECYRERFDIAVARAVRALPTLLEYTLPLVKQGGNFYAYKGPQPGEEIARAQNALGILGGELSAVLRYSLPAAQGERTILKVKKVEQTPPGYPRNSAKIGKNPL